MGAFVGFAMAIVFMLSPIVPLEPVMIIRIRPNIPDAQQEQDESRALLGAGILFAMIGTIIAAVTNSLDRQVDSSISAAGVLGAFVGVGVVIGLVLWRHFRRQSLARPDRAGGE